MKIFLVRCFLSEAAPTAKPVVIYESESESNVSNRWDPFGSNSVLTR